VTVAAGRTDNIKLELLVTEALAEWLPERLEALGVPGASVGVTTRNGLLWAKAYGRRERGNEGEVSPETLFCIRSLTKSITALGVLVAVQEGLLDLDTPVVRYAPDCLPQTRYGEQPEHHVTLRHLLANRAGFTHDEPPGNADAEAPGHFERRIAAISRSWFRFPVGLRYAYSNLHFDLAGYIVQVAAGMPFAKYMMEAVLKPLGMHDTTYDWRQVANSANLARGHAPDGTLQRVGIPEGPSAGVYSNVPDMSRFFRFHLDGGRPAATPLLNEDLMAEYRRVQFPHPGQRAGYCLGILRQRVSDTYSLCHSGGGHGYQTQQIIYPELGFAVVLLTNLDGHGLTVGPLQQLLDDIVREQLGPEPATDALPSQAVRLTDDDPRIQAVLGRYWEGGDWVVEQHDGKTLLRTESRTAAPLVFYEDAGALVAMRKPTELLRFAPGERGAPPMLLRTDLRLHGCDYRVLNGAFQGREGPNRSEWSRFCGDYDILWQDKPIDTVHVHVRNGYLYFDDRECTEHEPGLFFTCDGEAIDFRGSTLTAANMILRKR